MMCQNCTEWCATTEAQLNFRRKNLICLPNAAPYPCPFCDGTEWATSDKMIKTAKRPAWRAYLDWVFGK